MDPGKDMVVEKLLEEKFKAFTISCKTFAFPEKHCASSRNFFCSFAFLIKMFCISCKHLHFPDIVLRSLCLCFVELKCL